MEEMEDGKVLLGLLLAHGLQGTCRKVPFLLEAVAKGKTDFKKLEARNSRRPSDAALHGLLETPLRLLVVPLLETLAR